MSSTGTQKQKPSKARTMCGACFSNVGVIALILISTLLLSSCGGGMSAGEARQLKQVALLGHGTVEQLAWSPDGTLLAVAGSIGLWLYNTDDLQAEPRLLQNNDAAGWVRSVAFSSDGNRIAIGDNDGIIRVRDVESGEELAVMQGHSGGISSIAFSPDSSQLVTTSDYIYDLSVRIWNVATGELQAMQESYIWPMQSATFAPDGTTIIYTTADGIIHLWDSHSSAEENERRIENNKGELPGLALSSTGTTIAAGDVTGTVRLWNLDQMTEIRATQVHTRAVTSVQFSPDDSLLASGGNDGSVHLWQVSQSETRQTLLEPSEVPVMSVAFSPNGSRLAAGQEDGAIYIWDVASGERLAFLPSDLAYSVAFSPDGTRLAIGGKGTLYMWDREPGTRTALASLATMQVGIIHSVAFNPADGNYLAIGGENGMGIINLHTGQAWMPLEGHSAAVNSVAFSPDGSLLATASDDMSVRLWTEETGQGMRGFQEQAVFQGNTEPVKSVAFHPKGELIASASSDGNGNGSVRLWNVATGEQQRTIDGVNVVAFSPGGKLIAVGSDDGMIRLRRVDNDELWSTLQGHKGMITALMFTPGSGAVVASGSMRDFGVFLWKSDADTLVETNKLITTLPEHTSAVWSVAFRPDGHMLASASFDGSVRLWSR